MLPKCGAQSSTRPTATHPNAKTVCAGSGMCSVAASSLTSDSHLRVLRRRRCSPGRHRTEPNMTEQGEDVKIVNMYEVPEIAMELSAWLEEHGVSLRAVDAGYAGDPSPTIEIEVNGQCYERSSLAVQKWEFDRGVLSPKVVPNPGA